MDEVFSRRAALKCFLYHPKETKNKKKKTYELGSWHFEIMFTPHNMSNITCHMSSATCHMSCVTCHMSCVACHFFSFFLNKIRRKNRQNGEAYRWSVCYQWGLPRLVSTQLVREGYNKSSTRVYFFVIF